MNTIIRPKRRQTGFSLLEVLVAILILAVGLLGQSTLQLWGLRYSNESYTRTQANLMALDLAERMHIARPLGDFAVGGELQTFIAEYTGLNSGVDGSNCPPAADCEANDCDVGQLAAYDICEVYNSAKDPLGDGVAMIRMPTNAVGVAATCVAGCNTTDPIFRVTITWAGTVDSTELPSLTLDFTP